MATYNPQSAPAAGNYSGRSYAMGSAFSEDPLLAQAKEMAGDNPNSAANPAQGSIYKNMPYIPASNGGGNYGTSDLGRISYSAQGLSRTGGCQKCNLYR